MWRNVGRACLPLHRNFLPCIRHGMLSLLSPDAAPDAEPPARMPGPFLVCTVGEIDVRPGASNVIAREASMTLDVRASDDEVRRDVVDWISAHVDDERLRRVVLEPRWAFEIRGQPHSWRRSAARSRARTGAHTLERLHSADAVACDERLTARLQDAASSVVTLPAAAMAMPSGAGHDAMALAHVAPIAMLFVRCRGGVSHAPEEAARREDVAVAARVLFAFLQRETAM